MNLPIAFEEKMKCLLGEEYDDYLSCFDNKRYYGLRINTNKITVKEFLNMSPFALEPIPWIENGFYYDGINDQPAKHPYYFAGLYYLQEPSAMTPANRLPIEPGDKVLDLCAAPGGKATELGARLKGKGILVANDISNSRAKALQKNMELFGIGNVLVISEDPGKIQEHFAAYFDKILIDAPCSGEGMFRKEKRMIKSWEERGPESFIGIQRELLLQAARMLKPGGILLYSTCTFDPRENEEAIEFLIEKHPEFELQNITWYEGFSNGRAEFTKSKNKELEKAIRIWPHKMRGEGHFMALLQKRKVDNVAKNSSTFMGKESAGIPPELMTFLENINWKIELNRLKIKEEKVYYMPANVPDMKGIRFVRTGLFIGELKKQRFEPSQALAMYLKKEEYKFTIDFAVNDQRVIRYLKGETIDAEDIVSAKEKGWYLICVDGYPLGFGKLVNQTIKNKYLPGWRWQS